jgi:hypothetical protein
METVPIAGAHNKLISNYINIVNAIWYNLCYFYKANSYLQMKRLLSGFAKLFLFSLISILFIGVVDTYGAVRTASLSGNWSSAATWGGNLVPTNLDDVTISNNIIVTVDIPASCKTLTTANTGALIISGTNTLAVTGLITMTRPSSNNTNFTINIGNGALSAGSLTMAATTTTRNNIITINSGTLDVAGAFTTGTTGCQINLTGAGNLIVGGGFNNSPTLTTATGSTVHYHSSNESILGTNYYNLMLDGTGTKTLRTGTTAVNGDFILRGTASTTMVRALTIGGNLDVGDGTSLTLIGSNFTVAGNTTIGNGSSGQIIIPNTGGSKTFTGDVTINNGATWNNSTNEAVTFGGNFNNLGTFNANSAIQTFSGSGKTISGTNTIASIAINGNITNNGSLTVTTVLSGTGTLTNGGSGTINVNFAGPPTVSNLNASLSGNTVNYGRSGNQTIYPTSYHHLTFTGSGTKTLQSATQSVGGNLTLGGTASITGLTGLTIGGDVILGTGTTFTAGNFTHSIAGNWTNNGGTFTPGNSRIIFNNAATDQSINGTTANQTFSNLTVAKSNSTIQIAGSTANVTISGNLTMTSGNVDCGVNTLILGTSTSATGTLTHNSGSITGNFRRWVNSTGTGIAFPVGTPTETCQALVTFSSLSGGTLTVRFIPTDPGSSGLPLSENSLDIENQFTEGYWSMIAANGLASTNYSLELSGNGFSSYTQDADVRIIKRPSGGGTWTLNGAHVAGSPPAAKRSGLSGFSEFAQAKAFTRPTVSFTLAAQTNTTESGTLTIVAQLSGVSVRNVSLPFTVGGTATGSNTDYTITPSPITIPAGSTSGSITISINADVLDESDETIIVTLGTPTNATLGSTTVHTVTINDNDPTPTVTFSPSSQSSISETGSLTIAANLSAASGQTITVPFTVSGTATGSGTDYTITTSPITFNPGITSASITININQDVLDETNETVIVTMGTPTHALQGLTIIHTATITDDDPTPSVTFTSASQSSGSESGTLAVTVQLSVASGQTVSVPFTISGTALINNDYTVSSSPITIPAGTTSASAIITINSDASDEPNETVILTMGTPSNASLGSTTVHTATITDDDPAPSVSFTNPSQSSINESGTMTATIQLSAPSANNISVPYTISGTASGNGTDFTITNGPISIPAGSTTGNIIISITPDGLDESDETVIITLGTPTNAILGTTVIHTATITDDDASPTVTFSTASQTSAGETGTLTVTLTISAATGQLVTIPVIVTGTATGGVDYTLTASPVTIAAGSTSATTTITILPDILDEINETVIITIDSPTNAIPGAILTYTGTITDDDAAPTVTFTTATQTSLTESGTITVTAQLSAISGQVVTVPFNLSGTATPATDYTITSSPITILAGSLAGTAIISIVSDAINEPNETVVLSMGTVTNAITGAITTHTATIINDDAIPSVTFTTANQSSLNESGTLTVTAQLSAASSFYVTVPFTITGTATGGGTDYIITPSPISINAGSTTGTAIITISEDLLNEANETIILTMGSPTHATQGAIITHTATITNDDALPSVSFTAASQLSINESGTLAVTARLSAASSYPVTVPFTVSGSATGGTDFTITSSPITIAAGNTTASATITISSDLVDEPNETVIITMGTPVNATIGAISSHTATITDDDGAPTVSFTTTAQTSVSETGTLTITALLSNTNLQAVTVPFTITGTALLNTDYTILASPITIPAGSTSGSTTLTITQDAIDELNETVIITLGTPTNATLGAITVHTITITDDDPAPVVSFSTAAQSRTESGTMTVTAQLMAVSGLPVTIAYSIGGTATSGTDYTISGNFITINAGSLTGTATISIIGDALDEPNETVILTMGTLTNAIAGLITVHTATINDDDATPTVAFTTASQTNATESGTLTVNVQLSAASGQIITVPFILGGTATLTNDYSITASPLTIPAGSTTATATVNIVADVLDEANETITITLTTPGNAALGASILHTITITDNDATPSVSFTTTAQTSAGETGTMTVTAQLSAISGRNVTVPFTLTGTATGGGTDYSITASPITITAGNPNGTLTITVTNDALMENNETIVITMGTPGFATAVAPTVHTATIWDDDVPSGSITVNRQSPENLYTPQQLVENVLVKGCLTASNITFAGTAVQIGHFTKGASTFEINEGIILSTGQVRDAEGPNYEYNTTTETNSAGDSQLNTAAGITSYDAAVLEFDFVPAGNMVEFNYVFASEEYLESVGQAYNDAFAFLLSGPGIGNGTPANAINIALIPGTSTPVSINTVHGQGANAVGNYPDGLQALMNYPSNFGHSFTGGTGGPWRISPTVNNSRPPVNGAYYIDNGHFTNRVDEDLTWANGNGGPSMEFDGRTTLLTASHPVIACQTYHIKLVIADAYDREWDSGVFLEGRSFTSNEIQVENRLSGLSGDKSSMYEDCDGSYIRFARATGASTSEPLTLNVLISGTAQMGIDYIYTDAGGTIIGDGTFPSTAIIPAGADYADYHYRAQSDGVVEGNETILFRVNNSCPCDVVPTYLEKLVTIIDETQILPTTTSVIQCEGAGNPVATITAQLQPGLILENYQFKLDGGAFQSSNVFTLIAAQADGSDLVGTSHSITVSDLLSCNSVTENNIVIPSISVFNPNAGPDIMMCAGQSGVILNGSYALLTRLVQFPICQIQRSPIRWSAIPSLLAPISLPFRGKTYLVRIPLALVPTTWYLP